jgi:biotin transport system substrate-specific component
MTTKYRNLTRVGLFCALIAVCSLLQVPFDPPFTLQTFAVFLCAGVLGGKWGMVAVGCYLALGAAGLPIFAGFRGGVGHLIGTTGGFLLGFLPATALAGFLPKKMPLFLRMLCGLLVLYLFGTAWVLLFYVPAAGWGGIAATLLRYVLPFLPFDVAKLFLAAKLTVSLKKRT